MLHCIAGDTIDLLFFIKNPPMIYVIGGGHGSCSILQVFQFSAEIFFPFCEKLLYFINDFLA